MRSLRRRFCLAALAWVALVATRASAQQFYQVVDLGSLPGGDYSVATGINGSGQVVGYASTAGGASHAFLYSTGGMTDLGTLGGTSSQANGINNSGQIVGSAATATTSTHAFRYSGGTMSDLGTLPGGTTSSATAVNDSGQVVGISNDSPGYTRAFLYSNGSLTDLAALPGGNNSQATGINNSGQVVGYSDTFNAAKHAFLFSNGNMNDLGTLGGTNSQATGINGGGQIVGNSNTANNAAQHAFLYSNGTMSDLGMLPGGNYSYPSSINNSGQVVGYSSAYSVLGSGDFTYSNGTMTALDNVLLASPWTLDFGSQIAINDTGSIATTGSNSALGQTHALVLVPTAVPVRAWTKQNGGSGNANPSWDTTTLSTNWANGAAPTSYANGNAVLFGDTNPAGGNGPISDGTVTVQASGVAPGFVTFNNSVVHYIIGNAGGMVGVTGGTQIVKNGTGTVTLTGANSFTGPVTINAGRINVQNSAALGNAAYVTVAPGAALELQGGVAVGNMPLSLTSSGLVANPAGALNSVSGNNSYAGSIYVSGGGATIKSSSPGKTLTLGEVFDDGFSEKITFSGAGNILVSQTLFYYNSTGTDTVEYNGTGTLTLESLVKTLGGEFFDSGVVNAGSGVFKFGPMSFQGGTLQFAAPFDASSSGVTINSGGATFDTNGNDVIFSKSIGNGGPGGLTKIGTGMLTLAAANTYTGGTTVNNGTLTVTSTGTSGGGGLTINGSGPGVVSVVNLNNIETVNSFSGAVSGGGSAMLNIGSGANLQVGQNVDTVFAGSLANSGTFDKEGTGTLEINGPPQLNGGSALVVGGGTMRFNVAASGTVVAAGVTATVANNARLELAGTMSALASGTGRVHIINNSTASAGLLVSGKNQVVGNIDGSGTTQVNAGSDLTANHIVQGALIIGGTAGTAGLVTIAASDSHGNPLAEGGLALAGSLLSDDTFGSELPNSANNLSAEDSRLSGLGSSNGTIASAGGNGAPAVPEPSALLLAALGLVLWSPGIYAWGRRRVSNKK